MVYKNIFPKIQISNLIFFQLIYLMELREINKNCNEINEILNNINNKLIYTNNKVYYINFTSQIY